MKLKLITAALAFLAAGSASAMTPANDVASGNSTLLLSVWKDAGVIGDVNDDVAYIRSLEVAMNGFGTQNRGTAGFTTLVDSNTGYTQSWTGGAAWASFVSGMTTAQIEAMRWDVTALDGNGGSTADLKRVLTTSNTNLKTFVSQAGTQIQNAAVTSATDGNNDGYWKAVIAAMGSGTEVVISDPNSGAFTPGAAKHATNFAGGMLAVNTMSTIGDADGMGFYYLTRSSSSNTAEAIVQAYENAQGAASFKLAANGTLTYMAPPPVPEADTYALMLAGLGLVGFIARRRKAD